MSNDKAPVAEVKATLAQVIAENPDWRDPYGISIEAFEAVYQRRYVGKDDRAELERIKWHAKRLLNGESGEWGGKREGAGSRKQAIEQEAGE